MARICHDRTRCMCWRLLPPASWRTCLPRISRNPTPRRCPRTQGIYQRRSPSRRCSCWLPPSRSTCRLRMANSSTRLSCLYPTSKSRPCNRGRWTPGMPPLLSSTCRHRTARSLPPPCCPVLPRTSLLGKPRTCRPTWLPTLASTCPRRTAHSPPPRRYPSTQHIFPPRNPCTSFRR